MFKKILALHAISVLAVLLFSVAAPTVQAQQTIKLIVGFPAGGGVDVAARIIAQNLQQKLGQPVIVDNRPGAGGIIAGGALVAAPADGLTLYMTETGFLVASHIYKNVKFSIKKDFEPVGMVASVPLALVSSNKFPGTNMTEAISVIRKSPGKYAYGSPGVGTLQHLCGELFKSSAKLDVLHAPYRGGAPLVNDLIGGGIELGFASLPSVAANVKAGKIRLLAVMSEKRLPSFPSTPTMSESVPGVNATPLIFVLAPAGTPSLVVRRLNQALQAALADGDTVRLLDAQGLSPESSSPAELGAWIRTEEKRWVDIVKQEKIVLE